MRRAPGPQITRLVRPQLEKTSGQAGGQACRPRPSRGSCPPVCFPAWAPNRPAAASARSQAGGRWVMPDSSLGGGEQLGVRCRKGATCFPGRFPGDVALAVAASVGRRVLLTDRASAARPRPAAAGWPSVVLGFPLAASFAALFTNLRRTSLAEW